MKKLALSIAFSMASVFAANTGLLVSNSTFSVAPSENGSLLVFSQGASNGGFSKIALKASGDKVHAQESSVVIPFENDENRTAVHSKILNSVNAEYRRTPSSVAGNDFGAVWPAYQDSAGEYSRPSGFVYVRGNNIGFYNFPQLAINYTDTVFTSMDAAVMGFAYDSTTGTLWAARGSNGLFATVKNGSQRENFNYVLNMSTLTLEPLKNGVGYSKNNNPLIYDVTLHPDTKCMLLATSKGLLQETSKGSKKFQFVEPLKNVKVTGVWSGGKPVQIFAETSVDNKGTNKLWRSFNGGKPNEVAFRDTTGKISSDVYSRMQYSTSNVAFIGNRAFAAVRVVGGTSGILKFDSVGAIPWSNENQWLYAEGSVVDRNVEIMDVTRFELAPNVAGLAVATLGHGISVSADSGNTWTPVLNQSALGKNLSTVRMVPSVIGVDDEALVAYSVSKKSKITIEVFSYDMRKVRTIAKDVDRDASASRSTDSSVDFWDGRDDMGRNVTMGVYYVRVKDNHGHVGWGKVMTVGGR